MYITYQREVTQGLTLNQREVQKVLVLFLLREAAKKVLFLVAGPLRGGGGLNGRATKEKRTFF